VIKIAYFNSKKLNVSESVRFFVCAMEEIKIKWHKLQGNSSRQSMVRGMSNMFVQEGAHTTLCVTPPPGLSQ